MKREYLIYKVTNKLNNKIYVGQTHYKKDEYLGSGLLISMAVNKYGTDNFDKEYIDEAVSQEELDNKERFWIKELHAQDKSIGYNIADGGWNDFTMNDEIKAKISKTLSGRTLAPGHIDKIVASRIANGNNNHTKETKKLLSKKGKEAYIKNPKLSDDHKKRVVSKETRKKMSDSNKGKKLSEETKQKISKSGKARNFHWSEEQKQKLRESNLNKHQKNSYWVEIEDTDNDKIFTLNNIIAASRFFDITKHQIKEGKVIDHFIIKRIYK